MKRRAIRWITMSLASAMIVCSGPQLTLQAMENHDITPALQEQAEQEKEEAGEEEQLSGQTRQLVQALERRRKRYFDATGTQ